MFLNQSIHKYFLAALLLGVFSPLYATHIVGGEITYNCLGNNQYEITLSVYRDCYNGLPDFDQPAIIGIYKADWTLFKKDTIRIDERSDKLPIVLNNPCLTDPPDVCVHRAIYNKIINLPYSPGGYHIVYQRCCRNLLIRNLPDPLNTGISYTATISEEAQLACNNAAVFNSWPPVAICIHEPVNFDHGATDPDGDSLVYRLCTPLNGPDSLTPVPNPPFAGPYEELVWLDPPYNLGNLLGGQPLSIDPQTGFMTGIPNMIGNFVVGVCVDEYRGDTLLSTTRRDFQFNVADCGKPTAAWFVPGPVCNTTSVQFQNLSTAASSYRWYFDWPNDPDNFSASFASTHVYPDTGWYTVALIVNPGTPCADTAVQQIHLTNSYIDAAAQTAFPDCDQNGLLIQGLDFTADTVFGVMSWFWTLRLPNGNQLSSSQQNPVFDVNLPGDYQLRLIAKSNNGCRDTAVFTFNAPIPPLNLLAQEWAICQGDTIALFPQADTLYDYIWTPGLTLVDSTIANPLAFPTASTLYTVTASGNGPCVRMGDVWVEVIDPGALVATASPDTIYQGQSSQLNAILPAPAQFNWSPDYGLNETDTSNPVATPFQTTTYTVDAVLSGGCVLGDSVRVVVLIPICEEPFLFFPTGFSPNGDGANDALKPEGRFIESVYWVIYNRWGEKIFETTSPEEAWDGTYKGQPLPPETFGYYIRVNCIGGAIWEKKGNVSLLR
ncbi:MAG: gliding motility-associated C-terminal domain-containing protein [Saprospiraceae bacterium]|nr:gliding motility-associated C-terminal domain-containing protein [Saprospiraceae bacterium]